MILKQCIPTTFSVCSISEFLKCEYCDGIVSSDINELLLHCKSCEYITRADVSHRYVCYTCEYHTHDSSKMKRHLRIHARKKPFKCVHCIYSAKTIGSLKLHIQLKHKYVNDTLWFVTVVVSSWEELMSMFCLFVHILNMDFISWCYSVSLLFYLQTYIAASLGKY